MSAAIIRVLARALVLALVAVHVAAAAVIPIAQLAPELEPHAASPSPPAITPATLSGEWSGRAPDGSIVRITLQVKGTTVSGVAQFGDTLMGHRAWTALRHTSLDGRRLSFNVDGPCANVAPTRGALRIISPSAAQLDVVRADGTGQLSITLSRAS